MTSEEAIESLDGCIVSEEYVNGKPNGNITCDLTREILSIAITALREKQERDAGCECCDNELHVKLGEKEWITTVKYYEIGNGGYHYVKPKYCPMCGRKLEVKQDV